MMAYLTKLAIIMFLMAAIAGSPQSGDKRPVFTNDGSLVLPSGFRSWVFIGGPITPNGLNDVGAPFPEFHSVYIEKENLRYYQESCKFPEGTILVKELSLAQVGKHPDGSLDSAPGRGYFPSTLNGQDVMVKDSKRFAKTNNWGFSRSGTTPSLTKLPPKRVRLANAPTAIWRVLQNGYGLGSVLPSPEIKDRLSFQFFFAVRGILGVQND